jgi:hypothetical protein
MHENVFAPEMALVNHPWTLLDVTGRKQGFDVFCLGVKDAGFHHFHSIAVTAQR